MGYRSCVALLLYGTPDKVDMVDNMLIQRLDPEYDRALFERLKQMRDEEGERTILWTFDDINEAAPEQERNFKLAVEFVRIGEEHEDNEVAYSIYADNALNISRKIEIPDNFEWRT